MSRKLKLTPAQHDTVRRARWLRDAAFKPPGDLAAHFGRPEPQDVTETALLYGTALGRAAATMDDLLAIIDQLTGGNQA